MESHQSKTAASIASVCRLCFMEREKLQQIFDDDNGFLCQWIEKLTSLKIIHVPNAPSSLCSNCKSTLEAFDSFREMCINNDHVFKDTFCGDNGKPVKFAVISIKMESDEDQETENDSAEDENASIKYELPEQEEEDDDASTVQSMQIDETEEPDGDISTESESEEDQNVANRDDTTQLVVTKDTLKVEYQDVDGVIEIHSNEQTMDETIVNENVEPVPVVKIVLSDTHKYPCKLCNTHTSKLHILTHKDADLYQCYICLREFHRFNYISKHIYRWHKDEDATCITDLTTNSDSIASSEVRQNSVSTEQSMHVDEAEVPDGDIKTEFEIEENENVANHDATTEDVDKNSELHSQEQTIGEGLVDENFQDVPDVQTVLSDTQKYPCKLCSSHTSKLHILTHKESDMYQCYICLREFHRFNYISKHVYKWHKNNESATSASSPTSCPSLTTNPDSISASEVQQNSVTKKARDQEHECTVCNRLESKKHCMTHRAEGLFECYICAKTFNRFDKIRNHIKWHVKPQGDTSAPTIHFCKICKKRETSLHVMSHKAVGLFLCNICKKRFNTIGYLNLHIRSHTKKPEKIEDINKTIGLCPTRQVKDSAEIKKTNSSRGDVSAESFSMWNEEEHQRKLLTVYGGRYPCKVCNKYISKLHLLTHKGKELFTCYICKKKFRKFDGVSRHFHNHVRQQKLQPKNNKQDETAPSDDNQAEEAIVSGSKEPSTSIDYEESSEIANSPTSTKSDESGEEDIVLDREFECKICNKYVSQLHAISHKPEGYQCPVCGGEFNRFDCFSRHVRSHKNKGKFVCDICSAGFSCTYRLNRHKRVAHGKQ